MPQFRYTATRADGARVEGSTVADTWQDVDRLLQERGFKLSGIVEIAPNQTTSQRAAAVPPSPVRAPAPAPAPATPPAARPLAPGRRPAIIAPAETRTKRATDKDLYFLFSQVSSLLKAGVNPAQAFSQLAQQSQKPYQREALESLSSAASQGRSVAQAMTGFPDLFPPHVVGLYRAGEVGGFLPAATEALADQAQNSHRFKRYYTWLGWCFVSTLASLPTAVWGARSLLAFWDKAEATGGQINPWVGMRQSFWEQLVATLPWTIATGILCYAFYRWWTARPNRGIRHKMVLVVPSTGKRARAESMAMFSWTLSHLFQAGMSPKSAVELAAESMPNLELGSRMLESARSLGGEAKLSEIAGRIGALTPEMQSVVQTGEYVGDLPGALNSVANAQRGEFSAVDQYSRVRIGCWMLLLILGGSLLIGQGFYRMFMDGMYERIMRDDSPQTIQLDERAFAPSTSERLH